MGSAIGAASHADSSAEQPFCQARCSPLLSCRKRRGSQKRQNSWSYHEDIWICIMSLLDARSLVRLAVTNRQFCALAKDESVWKALCLRELGIPPINIRPAFSWISLYMAAVDGSHSFSCQQSEKHIDWMRIGVFCVDSGEAIATDRLLDLKLSSDQKTVLHPDSLKSCTVSNVKKGVWIADLHLVRCPVCNLAACEGNRATSTKTKALCKHSMLATGSSSCTKSTRLANGSLSKCVRALWRATATKRLLVSSMPAIFAAKKRKTWAAPSGHWQPKGHSSCYGAAACTNLQPNQGLQVKFHIMKAGAEGPVVGIRVCQQLV